MDYYADKKNTLGIVFSGYVSPNRNGGENTTLLKNADNIVDSIVAATNLDKGRSNNFATNFNFRHSFDSTGKEYTVDLDYITYYQSKNQFFENSYLNPDYTERRPNGQLKGTLPAQVNIYSAKTDLPFRLKNLRKSKRV